MGKRWNRRDRRLTALACALGMLGSIAATPTAASATASATGNKSFHAAYVNIKRDLGEYRFRQDLEKITSQADIVGLGEVAGRRTILRKWANNHNWYYYAPWSWGKDNAVLARKSVFEIVARGSIFNCDTNGDDLPHPRYTNWVRYKHRATGRRVFHINTHLNPAIERNGWPRDNRRVECAKEHIREIRDLANAKRKRGQVIVTADMNINWDLDRKKQYYKFPYVALEDRGRADLLPALRSSFTLYGKKTYSGTKDGSKRFIDYVYFWKRVKSARRMWLMDYHIVGGLYSDHKAVVARFAIATIS